MLRIDVLAAHCERGADASKRKNHHANQRPITQANRRADVDAVEQLAGFLGIQYRRFPLAGAVAGPPDRGGGIAWHDLADDQPIEQMAEGGQVLLHSRRGIHLGLPFDPGRHVQRLHSRQGRHPNLLTPR